MRKDSFDWIVQQCRFKPRTIQILQLIWLDGMTRPGVGRFLNIRTSTVQKLEGRAKHKMQRLYEAAGPGEKALWDTMLGERDESAPLDRVDHAKALLSSMQGPRKHAPVAPEHDALGREIGRRPPIVSVDEAISAILAAERERGRASKVILFR